ncbi:hypothetical protein GUY44_23010 [Pimelobacter simplex]|uniref:Uncharacterized protein n=1 Tax=Nocardioides simplex TaxID=2045 RepID=A0A0A1DPP4_NOCSI|nr:hypothetical protein [Pimelobacter simplex]AIY18488.2 hypothetical protein KR76_20100 [Pimelobacter simplex]MCG8153370.1 hypothetical protein [Pimelobacter simplex]GEB14099.1 hypothetical protein NSI01_24140 [Pimelobacter simplex]SFM33894.1 hypothetical protein SAMN05421671_1323 [Pimelobacter simplex]
MHVLGPVLGASEASAEPGRAQSQVVSYRHRESYDVRAAGAALAGVHYVLVSAPGARGAVTTTLTLARSGVAAAGIPDYADGSLRAPPTASVPDDGDGGRTPLLVGGGIAAAVAALLVVVATRRAARARGR